MKKSLHAVRVLTALVLLAFAGCTSDNPSPSPADPRETFVGTWNVVESSQKLTYQASIVLDPSSTTRVLIHNFAGSGSTGNPAAAEVSGTSITLVTGQVIGDGWSVAGGGSLSGSNKINWTYTVNDGANLYSLTAVYTRI
jgi:hypothetical protein